MDLIMITIVNNNGFNKSQTIEVRTDQKSVPHIARARSATFSTRRVDAGLNAMVDRRYAPVLYSHSYLFNLLSVECKYAWPNQ